MNRLGEALTELDDPPVTVLFVYNCNPLATMPNQEKVRRGLERADLFTVVFDQVLTDTARYADVVLPATTFLEHGELSRGYGAMVLNRMRPVIAPVGEARSNPEVFGALCRLLDLSRPDEPQTAGEIADAILADHPRPGPIRAALDRDGMAEPPVVRESGKLVQFEDIFPATPDRKVNLFPGALDAETPSGLYRFRPDPATPRHPLALISPATARAVSSTLAQLDRREAALEMHPDDAAARGIVEGDGVRVYNELGEVRCAAAISGDLRPGVVCLPKGLWSRHTRSGTTANALCPDSLTDFAGGACFNDARVEVERAGT
jgi:anaerobic selenocysteine-containing dehydrogenase